MAQDLRADRRQVALKVLTPEAYATVQGKMLRREFEILSKLDHPHLVHVYDYGMMPDGGVFLAEEYVDGFSMQDARALFEPETLIDLTMQMLNGLSYLHGMGMIHRDIKPANVMLLLLDDASVGPMIKLVDFGLSSMDPKRDTLRGGTRSYMAPEIIRGEKGEPQSDMFSLGVTLYYVLCGALPFGPRTKEDPPPTDEPFRPAEPHRLNPSVPLSLSRFTMALLRQIPGVEFADAGEAMLALAHDTQETANLTVGRFANSLDTAGPQVLRGYFERGILLQQQADREYLVKVLGDVDVPMGKLYMLAGEPQLGKSSLLHEVETACKLSGRLVISLRACDPEKPWNLLITIFEQAMLLTQQRRLNVLSKYELNLRVLRELAARLDVEGGEHALRQQKKWMSRAFEDMCLSLADERPVMFIDDLDQSDDLSLEFLQRWFERSSSSLMTLDIVVAVSADPRLVGFSTLERVDPIICKGLTYEDLEHLLHGRMGLEAIGAPWMQEVVAKSKGQPAYLEEVCRALMDAGLLHRASAQHWELDEAGFAAYKLPQAIGESLRRRLGVVGASGREALELMAVLDRPMPWALLRDLLMEGGESRTQAEDVIETLQWRHFIHVNLDMQGRHVRPIHPEVKHVVDLLLSPKWRRALHRRVGTMLGSRWAQTGGELGEVIHHLQQAGKLGQMTAFVQSQIHQEMERADWPEVLRLLKVCLEAEQEPRNRCLLLVQRAYAALALWQPESSREAIEEARSIVHGLGHDWLFVHVYAQAMEVAWAYGDLELYATWLGVLRQHMPPSSLSPSRLAFFEGRLLGSKGETDQAKRLITKAIAQAKSYGDVQGMLIYGSELVSVVGSQGDAQQVGEQLQEVYTLSRRLDEREQLAQALLTHARLMRLGEEYAQAEQLLQDALDALSKSVHGALWVEFFLEMANVKEALGDLEMAEQRAIEALVIARQLAHGVAQEYAALFVSDLGLLNRPHRVAQEHLDRMNEAWAVIAAQPYHIHWKAVAAQRFGHALARLGHSERAAHMLKMSHELGRTFGAGDLFPA